MRLTYGSLFAGVGGFDQGFDRAGMECRWQVEWDKSCQKLLQAKWPNAKHHGDITQVRAADLERVDVICGGSPCQDLSVAGKRAGMAGGRSGLFHEMVRICKRGRPRIIVWENVDGAFSSNDGRDFAAVLRAFTGVQVAPPADGWGRAGFIKTPFDAWRWNCAWRVFDAQYFGVPQRRRRVFLVASLGDGRCSEILFEPESLRGDSPPSRGAGERVARPITPGSPSSSGQRNDADTADNLIPSVVGCLDFGGHGGSYNGQDAYNGRLIPAPIAFSSKDHGADACEDLSPTLRALPHKDSHPNGGGPPTITCPMWEHGRFHCQRCKTNFGVNDYDSNTVTCPKCGNTAHSTINDFLQDGGEIDLAPVAFDTTQITSPENRCKPWPGDPCHPLAAGAHPPAIAFHPTQDPISSTDGSTHALGCGSKQGSASVAIAFKPSHFTRGKDGAPEEIFPPLSADASKGDQDAVIFQECQTGVREYGSAGTQRAGGPGHDPVGSRVRSGMAVRRLTPLECERLMGWPDNHTAGFSDSVRYKMCGNGVVATCSAWIGKRIVKFLQRS